jgi:hypothetical protein
MYVGDQAVPLTKAALQFRARHGCYHIDSDLGGRDAALELDEAGYRAAIEMCAAEGVTLEMTHISIPESITLALDPERDADIARVCQCIENAGKAGMRGINYNFCVLGHQVSKKLGQLHPFIHLLYSHAQECKGRLASFGPTLKPNTFLAPARARSAARAAAAAATAPSSSRSTTTRRCPRPARSV